MQYNPYDWYWRADDGRVFASARGLLVSEGDAGYTAFVAANGGVPSWPRDVQGSQTTASMQEVLTPYGLFADLKAYAANVRYKKEVGGCSVAGVNYPSDRETQSKLTAAALFAQVDATQTFKWKLADGTFSAALSAAQMVAIAAAVGGFVNSCFATEASAVAQISAGTITTRAQVDASFA